MKDVRGTGFAGSASPFLGRERAAVDVDVGPERRSPRYHETCLALESVKEKSLSTASVQPLVTSPINVYDDDVYYYNCYTVETKARRGDGEYVRLDEEAG